MLAISGVFSIMRNIENFMRISRQAYMNTSPELITWEIASACNKRCSFCYHNVFCQESNKHASKKMIDTVLGFIKKTNVRGVAVSGGEPLLHPDFESLVHQIYKSVNNITVFTNGIGFNFELYKEIAKDHVTINYSFDYDDPLNYSLLERFISFMPLDRLKVSMVYSGQNVESFLNCIIRIRQIFHGDFQINYVHFKGHAMFEKTLISNMIEISKKLIDLNLRENLCINGQYVSEPINNYFEQLPVTSFNCSICRNIKIDVNGNIFPCPFFTNYEYCLGTVENFNLADLSSPSESGICGMLRNKLYSRVFTPKCSVCRWSDLCGGGCLVCLEDGCESGVNEISCAINSSIYSYINDIWKLR